MATGLSSSTSSLTPVISDNSGISQARTSPEIPGQGSSIVSGEVEPRIPRTGRPTIGAKRPARNISPDAGNPVIRLPLPEISYDQCMQHLQPVVTSVMSFNEDRLVIPYDWYQWIIARSETRQTLLDDTNLPHTDIMSPCLWPAITGFLDALEATEAKGESSSIENIMENWCSLSGTAIKTIEKMANLQLCKLALSMESGLTDEQKCFLGTFTVCQTQLLLIHNNIKDVLDKVELVKKLPSDIDLMPDYSMPGTDLEMAGEALFGVHCWEEVSRKVTDDQLSISDMRMPPESSNINPGVWRIACSFNVLFNQDHQCDLGTEFNVGEDDRLNSEQLAIYLRLAFSSTDYCQMNEQLQLIFLLDYIISQRNIQLTIEDQPANWRDWLKRFETGKDSIPGNEWKGMEQPEDSVQSEQSEQFEESEESGNTSDDEPRLTGLLFASDQENSRSSEVIDEGH